ncbi:MAG: HAMP domain-containing histidine kinase [Clostridium sp.]|nr:HAMP domain-containing histidine kinase [Clostridium sp.]
MKKRRLKKSIFTKLIGSFFLFLVIVMVTFVACLLLEGVLFGRGTLDSLMPQNIVDGNGNVRNIDAVKRIGGWVEELDADYQIVKVHGDKQTDIYQYTPDDLYQLAAITEIQEQNPIEFEMNVSDRQGYFGFIHKVEKLDKYVLCIYSRNVMQPHMTVVVNGDHTSDAYEKGSAFSALFLILLLFEVLPFSLYLRKKIKFPLDELVTGMERIRSGESGVILDIKTEAEFEQIVDTFNVMTRELEMQKEENARLIAQKNQMLLELSHDIRTPIATIKSYANALEAGLVPEEKQEAYYHTIDVKADRVQVMTEEMFFMLKMDNPDYNLNRESVNASEFLRKICAEYYDEIEGAGFDFIIDIPEEEIVAWLDVKLFTRVVGNLLSNAAKYNKSGHTIGVLCEERNAELHIRVTDDGEGIDDALAKQMFSAFVRGDKTRKSDGGTGLGLAISKIIVEKHGGQLAYRREDGKNVFAIIMGCGRSE